MLCSGLGIIVYGFLLVWCTVGNALFGVGVVITLEGIFGQEKQ